MGEKIRDLHPIKIGKSSLMIELNEGYTADEGRLIHIQNKKFRYLLKENDFYHLSTMVMRAWSEFDYIKNLKVEQKNEDDFPIRESVSDDTIKKKQNLGQLLQNQGIDYRFLDIQNCMLTLLVPEDRLAKFKEIIKKNGAIPMNHPLGKDYGYIFLYQMKPFMLFKLNGILLEVYCQLPCASLTPKTWIPLDRMIQKMVWDNKEFEDGVFICNKFCQFIYHLCWAIFYNKGFSKFAKSFLVNNKPAEWTSTMKECLSLVFFNYTQSLIDQIEAGCFDTIIPNYYSFLDY